MNSTFALLILGWTVIMVILLAIGGFFMFRKFLKRLPKEDGKSIIDWEEHYIDQTLHMWGDEQKQFLEELVMPVPELFRDVAKQKIAARIAEVALQKKANAITQEIIIEGYILATPKRDHKFLKKTLHEKNIDVQPYQPLFDQ
ncbi:hypothetical protein N780_11470 [Pontibacillus chungwhensis BH030062]|uniref:DUF2621 domain-containing protein n=1 Tax=Pontibacillus chungwhensis BH030062 TaxID=1385513 RepID=A0A0A2V2C7_9BACI|nr:DUF2621 domain-containing protein [Pontibacillus chungwhensis]KGP92956.1 hypothetical protein N780_11470 [Pontibacillus chungwhensis BH030062]